MLKAALLSLLLLCATSCSADRQLTGMIRTLTRANAEERILDYKEKAREIRSKVEKRDLDYLVENTGPTHMVELGREGVRQYYLEEVFVYLENNFEFSDSAEPELTFDHRDNAGYAFYFDARAGGCTAHLKVVVLGYITSGEPLEKLLIGGLSFKDLSQGCKRSGARTETET